MLKNTKGLLYSILARYSSLINSGWVIVESPSKKRMSTRAQINVVSENGGLTKLYVHCDGGFHSTGKALHNLLTMAQADNSERLVWLLQKLYGECLHITHNNGGDIEYYYEMNYKEHSFTAWKVRFSMKGIWKNGKCNVEKKAIDLMGDDLNYA